MGHQVAERLTIRMAKMTEEDGRLALKFPLHRDCGDTFVGLKEMRPRKREVSTAEFRPTRGNQGICLGKEQHPGNGLRQTPTCLGHSGHGDLPFDRHRRHTPTRVQEICNPLAGQRDRQAFPCDFSHLSVLADRILARIFANRSPFDKPRSNGTGDRSRCSLLSHAVYAVTG
jgi:hypothetical protein